MRERESKTFAKAIAKLLRGKKRTPYSWKSKRKRMIILGVVCCSYFSPIDAQKSSNAPPLWIEVKSSLTHFVQSIDSNQNKENGAIYLNAKEIELWEQTKKITERYIEYPSSYIKGINPLAPSWIKAKDALDDFINLITFLRIPDQYSDQRKEIAYAPNKAEIIKAWKRAYEAVNSCIEETRRISNQPSITYADIKIMGSTHITCQQAEQWAAARGATKEFISLAKIYWELAPSMGVNPWIAYCQAAKETGYGHFRGIIDRTFMNPCGLKKTDKKGDLPEDHHRFDSWRHGVSAHLDHLALYAGASGYPKEDTKDPRHFDWIRGRATTVLALGGNWGASKEYGIELLKLVRSV